MRIASRAAVIVTTALVAFTLRPAAAQVAEIVITPPTVTIPLNQRQSVLATAYDGSGQPMVTARIQWRSSDPNVVSVEFDPAQSGVATLVGVQPGVAQVEARVGNRLGTAAVQVVGDGAPVVAPAAPGAGAATVLKLEPPNVLLLPGESGQITPQFLTDDGSPASPVRLTWRSHQPNVVGVTDDGRVLAVGQGQGFVEASGPGGLLQMVPVQVTAADLAFTEPQIVVSQGMEKSLQVVVPSQQNRRLPSARLSWRSSNDRVVTVSPLGVARGMGAGRAQVTATGFLQETSVTIIVHRPVAELSVAPGPSAGPVDVVLGGSREIVVQALASDGTPVQEAPFRWSVTDTNIAAFDSETRTMVGRRMGTTELSLTGPGPDVISISWQVNVIAGSLRLNRSRLGLSVGDTVTLSGSYYDQAARYVGDATQLRWRSSNPAVATVSAAGVVRGADAGRARIIATTPWGNVADTFDLFVQGDLLFSSSQHGSPDVHAADRRSLGQLQRLTATTATDLPGSYSPDGTQIAFTSTRDGFAQVYAMNADGSDVRRLTDTPGPKETPRWTPDGRRIVYAAQEMRRMQVWIMNADGTGHRQLTPEASVNSHPAVSPDGRLIAFLSTRERGGPHVFVMNVDGTDQQIASAPEWRASSPAWFPDGRLGYLVEVRDGRTTHHIVVRRDLATGQDEQTASTGAPIANFAVSPDGRHLALETSVREGGTTTHRITLFPLAGGEVVDVPRATTIENHTSPVFRPARPPAN